MLARWVNALVNIWVDVAQVALSFGGGGHIRAAGCTIYAPVEEAREQLLAKLRELV